MTISTETFRRWNLRVNVDKSKAMVVGEESSRYEIILNGRQLKQVPEFKNLDYMLDEKRTRMMLNVIEKVVSGTKVVDAI